MNGRSQKTNSPFCSANTSREQWPDVVQPLRPYTEILTVPDMALAADNLFAGVVAASLAVRRFDRPAVDHRSRWARLASLPLPIKPIFQTGSHALRVHLQMLDKRTEAIQTKSAPENTGTKHLTLQSDHSAGPIISIGFTHQTISKSDTYLNGGGRYQLTSVPEN